MLKWLKQESLSAIFTLQSGVCGSAVGLGTVYKQEGRGFDSQWFFIYII